MQKKVLPYIEDYIEILSGYVGLKGRTMQFSLARYDVQIVASLGEQTNRGVGYTDRQALLAHKLVVKYKKQFAKHEIDIGFHEENGNFRLPIRFVDRGKTIQLVNNEIVIRFPYHSETIDYLRESGKGVRGSIKFDKDKKAWTSTITEPRLLWVEDIANKYQFDVDQSILDLIDQVKQCQQTPHGITLVKTDTGYSILNAESTLIDYINEHIGGFGNENVLKLIDYSGILGYTVSEEIKSIIASEFNTNQITLLTEKESHIPITNNSALTDIISYAELTNRLPIYVFENNDVNEVKLKPFLTKYFDESEILVVGNKQKKIDAKDKKCIYLNTWQPGWESNIPLLISMTSMMFGPRKQLIIQNSEKVVYCTDIMINYKKT